MKLYILQIIISLFLVLILYSCHEKIFTSDVDCEYCYSIKPDSVDLVVSLTYNDTYDTIPLVVYKEVVGENNIEYIDTAYGDTYYLLVPVNAKYSIKVEYKKDSITTYAIDATKVKIKRVSDACDEVCWVIENEEMDCRLKYE